MHDVRKTVVLRCALYPLHRFSAKYASESRAASKAKAVAALEEMRARLKEKALTSSSGRRGPRGESGAHCYLIGSGFTYADIVMATALQSVKGVGPPYSRSAGARMQDIIGVGNEYEDLLAWRDELFRRHWSVEEGR